ncbi:Type 1 glutamine amidotransferase-like domain-containing protein [Bacteriovoracaceae bacterium]|nr:Type 1 glutamine amidotransferase-like domain-containing protein [Bacteriovoracaceae bacterium]
MNIIMTGGGDSAQFEKIDRHFASLLKQNSNLLFIPVAGPKNIWNDSLKRIQTVFQTIKFKNVDMCIDLSYLSWNDLKKYQAIYFDGGNTFQLINQIRETHTYELLHRFLHQGGILNGDSAGAIIFGSHLETAHFGDEGDENTANVISYQGLNLFGSWSIHCHYEESQNDEIKNFSNVYGFPIIALHEDSSVYIKNKYLNVVGPNKVSIFRGNKKINLKPGDTFRLI